MAIFIMSVLTRQSGQAHTAGQSGQAHTAGLRRLAFSMALAATLATTLVACGGSAAEPAAPTVPPPVVSKPTPTVPPPVVSKPTPTVPPPVVSRPALSDVSEARTLILNISTTAIVFVNNGGGIDPDGCTKSSNLPAGLMVARTPDGSSCQIIGAPTSQANAELVTVTGSNTAGNDSAQVQMTVKPAVVAEAVPGLNNFDTDLVFVVGVDIAPIVFENDGGNVEENGCRASTSLPAGLRVEPVLDRSTSTERRTCQIAGRPTEITPTTGNLTPIAIVGVIGSNNIGSDASPALVRLTIAPQQPTVSVGSIVNGNTVVTVTNSSTMDGIAYILVLPSGAPPPSAASIKSGATESAEVSAGGSFPVNLSGLTVLEGQTAYVIVESLGVSSAVLKVSLSEPSPPIASLTIAITPTTTTVNIGSDQSGTAYVLVLPTSSPAPATAVLLKANPSTLSLAVTTEAPVSFEISGLNNSVSYTAYAVVTAEGGDSDIATSEFTIDTAAPVFSQSVYTVPVSVGKSIDENFDNTNTASARIRTCTAAVPAGLNIIAQAAPGNGCTLTGALEQEPTNTSFTVTATNGTGTVMFDLNLVILAPIANLEEASAQTYYVGQAGVVIDFVNNGGNPESCNIDTSAGRVNLPAGLMLALTPDGTSCQITGTPTLSTPSMPYTITATNSGGSADAAVVITVREPTPPGLSAPESGLNQIVGRMLDPVVVIGNSNPGLGAVIVAGSCVLVDGTDPALAQVISTVNGLQVGTGDNVCEVSGAPASKIDTTLNIRATSVEGAVDIFTLTFELRDIPPDIALIGEVERSFIVGQLIGNTESIRFTNTGGAITSCTVEPSLLASLVISATTCEITGTVDASIDPAMVHFITASSNTGDSEAIRVTISAENPPPPVLAAPGGIVSFSFTREAAITDIVLSNTQADSTLISCAVEPSLPAGLNLVASDENTCVISGTPTAAAVQASHAITATDVVGVTNDPPLSLDITVFLRAPMLESLAPVTLTARAQTGLPIEFINMGDDPDDDGCTASPNLPAGLRVALTDDGESCRLTGVPEDVDSPQTITVTVSATNANPAVATTADISITVNPAAPTLPEEDINGVALVNEPIETLVIPGTGGQTSACYFVVDDNSKPTTVDGLTVATAAAGCQLTGTLTNAGAITFVVGAENASDPTDTVQVDFIVLIGAQPVLNQPEPDSLLQTVGVSLATAPIALENINSSFPLDSDSCIFVDSTDEDTAAALATQNIDGLTISTDATIPGTCQVSGTPASVGSKTVRVRAVSGDENSNIVAFTVSVVNPPPNISTSSTMVTVVATEQIDAIDFTSDAGPVQSCSVTPALPNNLTLNTENCQITGIPAAVARQRQTEVTVTATNDGGDSSIIITITVNPQRPALTSLATLTTAQTYYVGEEGKIITLVGTGGNIDSCAFVTTAPPGLSVERFEESSCRIVGTPNETSDETTHMITATNASDSATATVAILVRAPHAPDLVAPTTGLNPIALQVVAPAIEVANRGTESGSAIAPDGCTLVNSASLTTARAITVSNGLGVSKKENGNACIVTGTPVTPGMLSIYIRATSIEGGHSILTLALDIFEALPEIVLDGATSRTYIAERRITPISFISRGGIFTMCRAEPALPTHLIINSSTCEITSRVNATVYPAATHRIIATNRSGPSVGVSITIRVNPVPLPAFADPGAINLIIDVPTRQTFANTEVGGGRINLCTGTVPPGLTIAPALAPANGCVLSGTPSTLTNAASFPIVATNDFGSTTLNLNIAVVAIPPAITSASAQVFVIGRLITPVVFSNSGGRIQASGCTIDTAAGHPALPVGLRIETTSGLACRISGTPTQETAQDIYTITASSLGGSDTATVVISVLPVPEPMLTNIAQTVLVVAGGGDIDDIVFTNTGSDATSCTGTAGAGAVSPDTLGLRTGLVTHPVNGKSTCRITGTAPDEGAEDRLYGVLATNDAGSSFATVTIGVSSSPNIAVQSRFEDNLFRYEIGAVDSGRRISFLNTGADISTCTVANENLPAGMSLDGTDCTITGGPERTEVATTAHTITATSVESSTETIRIETYHARAPQMLPFSARTLNLPPGSSAGLPIVFKNFGGNVNSCTVVANSLGGGASLGSTFDLTLTPTADGRSCQLARANTVTETTSDAVSYDFSATNTAGTSYFSITLSAQTPPPTPTPTLTPDRGNTYEFLDNIAIEPITFTTTAPGLCSVAPATANDPPFPASLSIDPYSCTISGFTDSATSLSDPPTYLTSPPPSYTITQAIGGSTASATISIAVISHSVPSFGGIIRRQIFSQLPDGSGISVRGILSPPPPPRETQFNLVQNTNFGLPLPIKSDGADPTSCFTELLDGGELAQHGLYIYPDQKNCVIDSIDGRGPSASEDGLDYTIAMLIAGSNIHGSNGLSRFDLIVRAQRPVKLSAGADAEHSCVTSTNGQLYCFGLSDNGELGVSFDNTASERPTAVLATHKNWTDISTASAHTCAVGSGQLYCWGNGRDGRLGLGDTASRNIPTRVGNGTDWSTVSAGTSHTCAIRSGQLYCWGDNSDNHLGLNIITATETALSEEIIATSTTPARIGDAADWSTVSTGTSHTCAIRSGQLYCWGDGRDGRLGLDSVAEGIPTRVGSGADWSTVSAGTSHTCATRSGQLYCWGNGSDGRLGLGNATTRNTPVRVGSGADWSTVSAGTSHTCATRRGATRTDQLYCWGNGSDGRLGLGSTTGQTAPTQVGSGQPYANGWHSVTAAASHTCAVRTDTNTDQLYCWGNGSDGRLGLGSTTGQTAPTAVDLPVSDGLGTLNPDIAKPVISLNGEPDRLFLRGTAITPIGFVRRGGVILDCAVSPALPDGLVLNKTSCQITGTPSVSVSLSQAYTVTAYSATGFSSASVNIAISSPEAPVLSDFRYCYLGDEVDENDKRISICVDTVPLIAGDFSDLIVFTNTGDGVGGENSCSASPNLPVGLEISVNPSSVIGSSFNRKSSCQITGVPTQVVNPAAIVMVTGRNSGGSDTATVRITVSAQPPPVLDNITETSRFQSGEAIDPIVFTNTGSSAETCAGASGASNPANIGLNVEEIEVDGTTTCRITGTAPARAVSAASYGVRASNAGGSDTATVSIEVFRPPSLVPVFTDPDAIVVVRDRPANQTFTDTTATATGPGPGGRVTRCTGTLPRGLRIDPAPAPASGCVLTGTPATATSGARVYAIVAANDNESTELNLNITVADSSNLSSAIAQTFRTEMEITPVEFTLTDGEIQAGGCDINTGSGHPALPTGLMLAPSGADPTGDDPSGHDACRITGTPTKPSPETVYTITARHAGGSDTAIVAITVLPVLPPRLLNLDPIVVQAGSEVSISFTNVGGDAAACYTLNEDGFFAYFTASVIYDQLGLSVLPIYIDYSSNTPITPTCIIEGTVQMNPIAGTYTIQAFNFHGASEATVEFIIEPESGVSNISGN